MVWLTVARSQHELHFEEGAAHGRTHSHRALIQSMPELSKRLCW